MSGHGCTATQNIEGFLAAANEAAKVILETVKKDGFILVFSHLDADGVAAAGVMGKMLTSARCTFPHSGYAVG